LNPRHYWRHFRTPRYDWLQNLALEKALPRFEFAERDLYEFGDGDLCKAVAGFAEHHRLNERTHWSLVTRGMWGGYRHLMPARDFVRAKLQLSAFAERNLLVLRQLLDDSLVTVGVHVRLGDFQPALSVDSYRGRFNVALPLAWYANVMRSIHDQIDGRVQFLIVTDGDRNQIAPLLDIGHCVTTTDIPYSDVSDMLALANADLLICSVSSYSAWAAFLSDSPYLWFQPNLQERDGFYSIWGHEPRQEHPGGYTHRAMQSDRIGAGRGYAVGLDGEVPTELMSLVMERHGRQDPDRDLLLYGVVRSSIGDGGGG
jgi:hypothetical protein